MRKKILLAAAVLCLAGCSRDTVIYIPAEPEWVVEVTVGSDATEALAPAEPEETEKPGDAEPTSAAQIRVTGSATSKKKQTASTGGSGKITATEKPASTKPSGTKPTETKPTEIKPAETKPEETEPAQTQPAGTMPLETEPAETEPPVTESPETQPPETEPPLYDISGYRVGSLEYGILDRINEYRQDAELEELWLDEWLCAICSCRAYESSLVWSHTRPDGRSYTTVLTDYGYGAGSAKELLVHVYGSTDGTEIVDKWMSSDSQKEMLLGGYSTLGVGVYQSGGFTYVACLIMK